MATVANNLRQKMIFGGDESIIAGKRCVHVWRIECSIHDRKIFSIARNMLHQRNIISEKYSLLCLVEKILTISRTIFDKLALDERIWNRLSNEADLVCTKSILFSPSTSWTGWTTIHGNCFSIFVLLFHFIVWHFDVWKNWE